MLARTGQQSGEVTMARVNSTLCAARRLVTRGIASIVSKRWSSVMTTMKFSGGLAWASAGGGPATAAASTASARAAAASGRGAAWRRGRSERGAPPVAGGVRISAILETDIGITPSTPEWPKGSAGGS